MIKKLLFLLSIFVSLFSTKALAYDIAVSNTDGIEGTSTIHVAKAGTLPDMISESEKYQIKELTLTGELNGTDFRLLRDMAGNNYLGEMTNGKLEKLDISNAQIVSGGLKYIDTQDIRFGSGMVSVHYHNISVTPNEIPYMAFCGCTLESIVLPNSVEAIGESAFLFCSSLTSVTIPNIVKSIGEYAFKDCRGLSSITIPNSVTSIGKYAFQYCSALTSITIPNSVTCIENGVFRGCRSLTSVTIPNSVTSIGNYAFFGCSGLTSVTIPNSVTSIGDFAFRECSGLTSVTIPNSVTSIGMQAFYGCSGLTSVTIPNSVTKIGGGIFGYCSNLTTIKVESDNKYYDSRNNCNAIIDKSTNKLIVGCNNTTIPNSVISIGKYAFLGCSEMTSITIPNSVTSIGENAFDGCNGLTSIDIPNSVTSIENGVFRGCRSLTSVTIPNSVTSIGMQAFYACDIEEVISKIENPFSISSNTFNDNTFNNCKLYVPIGTIEKYNTTEGWKNFAFIEEMRCEKPTIAYKDGILVFSCATEGVTYQYNISSSIKSGEGNNIDFTPKFTITAYATKDGYDNSETATLEVSIGDANCDGIINAADITTIVNIIMGQK